MPTTQPRLAGDRVKSDVLFQRILIRDLTLSCSIGVSDEERARRQRLRIKDRISAMSRAIREFAAGPIRT